MADDYISRQAAIDALGEEPYVWDNEDGFEQGLSEQWRCDKSAIEAVPSADVRENVRGCWINIEIHIDGSSTAECDKCNAIVHSNLSEKINFCPNCGADMRGESDEIN